MQAIEFETLINHSSIAIPLQYQEIDNVKAKVIVLFSETEKVGNYNKQNLLNAFAKAQQKGIFNEISNSINWQKDIRNEWE